MPRQPNLVFVFSDQHNPNVIGAAGDEFVRTPRMDRLMHEGVTLNNCYCASPWCVPSRMSMLTSLLPSRTGIFTNDQTLSSSIPTLAHGMAAAGYETVLCGRMHFLGMDQWHGYEKRPVGEITATLPGAVPLDYGSFGVGTGQSARGAEVAGPGRSFVMEYDREVTEGAVRFLQERRDERPLFMTIGHYGPHCPFVCPRDLFAYYWERLPVPEAPADSYESHHPSVRRWMDRRGLTTLSRESVRAAQAAYYGLVELMDQHLGTILESVAQTLDPENTLVVYGSDHGEMMGRKGLFWKSNFFDGSARVPLICHQPGGIEGGRTIDTPTSLLDVAPTFLNLAGGPSLPGACGQPLDQVLPGNADPDPDREVVSMLVDRSRFPACMIRRHQWKLVDHHDSPIPQLFNLDEDPDENRDLGQDPATAEVRRDLRSRLRRYWDPEAALENVRHVDEQSKIIRSANAAALRDPPAQWRPSRSMNEIEEWPPA